MEYLYVGTTYVKISLLLDRLPLFLLQGNIQVDDRAMGALGFGEKLINIVKEVEFFKDTKIYDDDTGLYD